MSMKFLLPLCILFCSTQILAQIKKIQLQEMDTVGMNVAASHSVAIDRKDVKNVVVSSYNSVYVSRDSARTWKKAVIESREMGSAGNVQLFSDRKGNLTGFHLADPHHGNMSAEAIVC